jgi:hypothetical protein
MVPVDKLGSTYHARHSALANGSVLELRASSLQQQRVSNDGTQEPATRVSATPGAQSGSSEHLLYSTLRSGVTKLVGCGRG